jgi:hypothetical protein
MDKTTCILDTAIGPLTLGDKVTGDICEIINGSRDSHFTVIQPARKILGTVSKITCYSKEFSNNNRFSISGENGYSEIEVTEEGFCTAFDGRLKVILTIL